jgi:hypothetical protein
MTAGHTYSLHTYLLPPCKYTHPPHHCRALLRTNATTIEPTCSSEWSQVGSPHDECTHSLRQVEICKYTHPIHIHTPSQLSSAQVSVYFTRTMGNSPTTTTNNGRNTPEICLSHTVVQPFPHLSFRSTHTHTHTHTPSHHHQSDTTESDTTESIEEGP